jgi:hypothetical protein
MSGKENRIPPGGANSGAVYGFGLVGALVWYWRRSEGFGGHVVGVLKALVWPAFLVYDVLKVLNRFLAEGTSGASEPNGGR